ncbi:helix-turn-helix transcriptional regulator [Stecheria sp. CLA-KB-P133]|uniref:Helix-turn-helix transcriptional regulator n=1 Tax=Grylomicrobium aquisgranensis TaxID=2926318 RepID=A0AB35U586_9FIRM|nr:helix-turn-helix transcriptional regulator [Lactimicrobium massiliense]MDD6230978.1 helix-turn-helix transcriptional regulator [Lactimicrobium massiliense]MDD6561300.1 helix-turn-helix transcriptional regulator [Lactimicrobium massiliense]MDX8419071.1 helix-turn-helix transcriptional regulator [Stecheria sp. CLA-KB-P133]
MATISYNRLWKLLIDKGMKKKDLREATGISSNTVARMGRNEIVSLEVLVKICDVLDCDLGDVAEVIHCKEE